MTCYGSSSIGKMDGEALETCLLLYLRRCADMCYDFSITSSRSYRMSRKGRSKPLVGFAN